MTSLGTRPPRLREKVKHILSSTMLCCGRRKETRESVETQTEGGGVSLATGSGYRRGHGGGGGAGPSSARGGRMPEMVVQGDFRKVSGISTEIFRQIEAVENDFDPAGAGQLMEAVEKRGEMIIRLLDPLSLGRAGAEVCKRHLQAASDSHHVVQFVEIIKRPGQTLGLYIREGDSPASHHLATSSDGPSSSGGVFISRIALESAVYDSGLLRVGDEILAVNLVDVRRMSLDDVVIIMSIPRRLVLTIRSRISGSSSGRSGRGSSRKHEMRMVEEMTSRPPPVVVLKRELQDEEPMEEANGNGENGQLMRARTKGLPADMPLVAVPLQHQPQLHQSTATHPVTHPDDRCLLYYNSQPPPGSRKPPPSFGSRGHLDRDDEDEYYGGRSGYVSEGPSVVTRQPKGHQPPPHRFAKTLETLAEQVHSFYPGQVPPPPPHSSSLPPSHAPPPPPMVIGTAGSTFPRQRYWEEHGSLLRRPGQLPRAESDQRIPLLGSSGDLGAFDRYGTRTSLRASLRTSTSMQARGRMQRRFDDGTATLPVRQQGILRRRTPASMESASDTECTSGPSRDTWLRRQHQLGARVIGPGGTTARGQQSRSNSLPRARVSDHDYRRQRQPATGVRFEPRGSALQAYYDSQDESDGAVSAPELPSSRSYRQAHRNRGAAGRGSATIGPGGLGRGPTGNFTSAEYRAWMSRAPSTSAIYDKVRRSNRFPQPMQSRIAHSAESLLDSLRQESRLQQFQRGMFPSTTLLRSSSLYGDNYEQHQQRAMAPYGSLDYFRRQMGLQSLGAVGPTAVPHPTPVKPSEDRLHLLTLNPREFFRYKPERDSEAVLQADGFSGLLWVHLLAGRGLRSTTGAGTAAGDHHHQREHFRDLYCVIECDRAHKARTVVRTGDHSFDWDEVFELDIIDVCEVSFLLYSWDPQFRHKLCYKGTIHLLTILRESPSHSVALKLEPRGTLYLKLRYRDPRQTFQRMPVVPAAATPAYFGVDLETVLNREGSPSGVPLVVRRCAEEVEKRGLDVVAIYRLCGSAVRKKTLREALERDPSGVDLTSDHVPDINVVTSLLKDYLRELPEPLFAKGLFDMLVDGLSVCLPEDPEGNAKLMFSILECLPRVNRCTVLYLMDHLKLVSSRSGRNKMTSQHLAVCFGPILMCHTESGGAPVTNLRKPIEICQYLMDIWPSKRAAMALLMVADPPIGMGSVHNLDSAHSSARLIPSEKSLVGPPSAGGPGSALSAGPQIEKKAVAWGPVIPAGTTGASAATGTNAAGLARTLPESAC